MIVQLTLPGTEGRVAEWRSTSMAELEKCSRGRTKNS